jgi:hypothetical protein
MPTEKKQAALVQIDSVLKRYAEYKARWQHGTNDEFYGNNTEVSTRLKTTIDRLAPPGTTHRKVPITHTDDLAATLRCLRHDYDAGYLQTYEEMIHGATFADFLSMAAHLLSEGYKDAAAVIAGGVLEQHLRALCTKHDVDPTFLDKAGNPQPKMINAMNTELYKPAEVYALDFMQQITAWAVIRNHAAHAEWDKVDKGKVELMIPGLRHFMSVHPA